jgi:cysteinyl-tRNA synthetase
MAQEIHLFDTWQKQSFILNRDLNGDPLKVYVCGPTVYTNTHIGHIKTYMTFDIIRSVLEYLGINMFYMMNITNVDDKIIKATYQKEYGLCDDFDLNTLHEDQLLPNQKFVEFADYWEKDFFDILDQLRIKRPNIVSRVTDYIDEIFQFVDEIDKKGYAFENNGSVYFYGTKYSNIKDPELMDYSKHPNDPKNFVLLKKAKKYEPGWESKWGIVRPGWHIECSAMASSVFGSKIDIHGGEIDLKFPHHHNELLQSNARFGHDCKIDEPYETNETCNTNTVNKEVASCGWVDNFMHTGHLNIVSTDGCKFKMSRSLKNFITVSEILQQYSADQLRMLFLTNGMSLWITLLIL